MNIKFTHSNRFNMCKYRLWYKNFILLCLVLLNFNILLINYNLLKEVDHGKQMTLIFNDKVNSPTISIEWDTLPAVERIGYQSTLISQFFFLLLLLIFKLLNLFLKLLLNLCEGWLRGEAIIIACCLLFHKDVI